MNKFLLYFIMVLIFLITVLSANAVTYTENINESQIPYAYFAQLNVTIAENATLNITRIDTQTHLTANFTNSIQFVNTTWKVMNWTLRINEVPEQNVTYTALFRLSNNNSNITSLFNISINVSIKPPEDTIIVTKKEFMTVKNGNYYYNISEGLLPISRASLDYSIGGLAGKKIIVTCSHKWLDCPKDAAFGANNVSNFKVYYSVPFNASLGKYNFSIKLQTGNITRNTYFILNIDKSDFVYKSFDFYSEDCIKEIGNGTKLITLECAEEYQKYNQRQYEEWLKILRRNNNYTCDPEIETKFVIAGEISEELKEQWEDCKEDRINLNNEVSDKNNQISKLQIEKDDLANALNNNESTCLENIFSTSVKLKEAGELERKKAQNIVFISFGTLLFITFLIWAIHRYKENNEKANF